MTKSKPLSSPAPRTPAASLRAAGIREVARQAGVSIATVSRALGSSGAVSPQTRERVLERATALGYQPSPLGRNLVRGRSDLLGLIVPNVSFPLYSEMIRAVEDVLSRCGMSILLASSHDDAVTERRAAHHILRHAVDGGIVINSKLGAALPVQRRLGWVQVASEVPGLPNRVELDNQAGGALAARELLATCRRRFAYVGASGRESQERERGFARTLAAAKLTYHRFEGDYSELSGLRAGEALLSGGAELPDAVFAAGDLMAAGVLRALHQRGLKVPQQVAVIGFDDAVIASLLYPRLTSIRQPAYPMGVAAAELALRLISGQSAEPVMFTPELVRRESTGPPG